jgi:hypothetical protein
VPERILQYPLLVSHLGLRGGMLNRAAATDAIVGALRRHPIRRMTMPGHCLGLDIARAFAQHLGVDTFAREGPSHEDHLPFVVGDALSLKVYRLNLKPRNQPAGTRRPYGSAPH